MERVLIIVNPHSGDKSSQKIENKLQKQLEQNDIETKTYETTGQDDFKNLIQNEMDNGLDVVITLGGDGTISEVINGIAPLKKRPKVLSLPLGTTNNFVRALGMELDLNSLLATIEDNDIEERRVDIGHINDQYFVSTVSVGSIPEVAWKTDDHLKEELGSLAYVFEGAKVINEFTPMDIQIECEEGNRVLEDVFLVIIGLTNSIFGIKRFFDEATYDDGKLHFYALKKSSLLNEASSIVKHIIERNNEEVVDDELSFVTSFKKATISSLSSINSAIDGEKGPKFPLELEVLSKHITFLIPNSKE